GQLNGVTWTGSQFVAVAQVPVNNSNAIFTSSDGTVWTARDADIVHVSFLAAAASPSTLVAVGGATISSSDAVTWELRMVGTTHGLRTAVKGPNVFIVAGDSGAIEYSR